MQWVRILVSAKLNKHDREIKEWRKIYYLEQVRRAQELFPKPCPPQTKRGDFIQGASACSCRKHVTGRHIPERTQFKVLLQEGQMKGTFWETLMSR
jgi:hypothetical protein